MKATEILQQIASERGLDFIGKGHIDLVPLNDLDIHKREVWNMTITNVPEEYFQTMNRLYRQKIGYTFSFKVSSIEQGRELCRELSHDFGMPSCEMMPGKTVLESEPVYLAIHIHSEFSFTPKTNRQVPATQDLVVHFS
jgi:hypothetical protein